MTIFPTCAEYADNLILEITDDELPFLPLCLRWSSLIPNSNGCHQQEWGEGIDDGTTMRQPQVLQVVLNEREVFYLPSRAVIAM